MFNSVCDLTVGTFEHLKITSKLNIYQRIKCTECILTAIAQNKSHASFLDYKDTASLPSPNINYPVPTKAKTPTPPTSEHTAHRGP